MLGQQDAVAVAEDLEERVEPSMSVNRRVTVPPGSWAMGGDSSPAHGSPASRRARGVPIVRTSLGCASGRTSRRHRASRSAGTAVPLRPGPSRGLTGRDRETTVRSCRIAPPRRPSAPGRPGRPVAPPPPGAAAPARPARRHRPRRRLARAAWRVPRRHARLVAQLVQLGSEQELLARTNQARASAGRRSAPLGLGARLDRPLAEQGHDQARLLQPRHPRRRASLRRDERPRLLLQGRRREHRLEHLPRRRRDRRRSSRRSWARPGHRANILGRAWDHIGSAPTRARTARRCGRSCSPTSAARDRRAEADQPKPTQPRAGHGRSRRQPPRPKPKPAPSPTARADGDAGPTRRPGRRAGRRRARPARAGAVERRPADAGDARASVRVDLGRQRGLRVVDGRRAAGCSNRSSAGVTGLLRRLTAGQATDAGRPPDGPTPMSHRSDSPR